MESKTIAYIVILIIYAIYQVYKTANKKEIPPEEIEEESIKQPLPFPDPDQHELTDVFDDIFGETVEPEPVKQMVSPIVQEPTEEVLMESTAMPSPEVKSLNKIVEEIEGADETTTFDLREAVIQRAILDRPYQ